MDLTDKSLKLTKKKIDVLNRLGIYDTDALLSYYPTRYDVLNILPYSQWKVKEHVTFEAEVVSRVRSFRKGRLVTSSFEVMYDDHVLRITIFNRPWASKLMVNDRITITGIYMGKDRVTAMTYDTKPLDAHPIISPVYALRAGITQKMVRDAISRVYEACQNEIHDIVPEPLIEKYRLMRRFAAIRAVHFPSSMQDVKAAYRTLKYEEFLKFFTAMNLLKNENATGLYKAPKQFDVMRIKAAVDRLPFSFTKDQSTVLNEILADMSSTHVMYRLVQGDVGCGKTAVAAFAMLACVYSGYQAALLAPTEILARQHYESVKSLLAGEKLNIALLYSGMSEAEKEAVKQGLSEGTIDIVTGTHALLEEDVSFQRVGLVIADEQQRFGVAQRRALRQKGVMCDFLLMSATPIPRTLASTVFGDMDISTIETMPEGRKIPITRYIEENSFRSVLDEVKALLQKGRQLYIICAAVEKNEEYHVRNVAEVRENVQKLFPEYKVAMLYGKMSSLEKQEIMRAFADNEAQILVSTTVVEVGMNVVNATGMIVYDADRFGLSQLHQLRGRIQRGSEKGYCWLLSDTRDEKSMERLQVLVKTCNGFEISYEDLRLRGPGDILGTRQSGLPDFIIGNLVTDTAIINTARSDAQMVVNDMENAAYSALLDEAQRKNTAYTD